MGGAASAVRRGIAAVGRGIAAVGKAVANTVKLVAKSVVKTVKFVKKAVVKTVEVVKKVAKTVGNLINTVSNGISTLTKKIGEGLDYLADKTGLKKIYNYCMNETFIGQGIKWIGKQAEKVTNYFFEETMIGRGLSKAKQWLDNTPVGKLFNALGPVVKVGSFCLGGVGGIIGKTIGYAGKAYDAYNKVSGTIFNSITANPVVKYVSNKAKTLLSPIITAASKFLGGVRESIGNKVESFKENILKKCANLSGTVLNKIESIPIVKKTCEFMKPLVPVASYGLGRATEFVEKVASYSGKFINKYDKMPAAIYKTIKTSPVTGYLSKKAGEQLSKIKNYAVKQFNNKFNNTPENKMQYLFREEKEFQNVSSENMADHYIKKFSQNINNNNNNNNNKNKNGLDKFLAKFEIIQTNNTDRNKQNAVKSLNSQISNSSISVKSINFNRNSNSIHTQHSIDGVIKLQNNTKNLQKFEILEGQLFGCKTPNSSQHTVVRGIKGELKPLETESFNLQAFCADSSLHWPHDSNDYDFTSYQLKDFTKDALQGKVWQMTS